MLAKSETERKNIGRLEADERTLAQVWELGRIQATTREAAAVLGVPEDTFLAFLTREPEAEETFEQGKAVGRVSLRRIQFKLAETNAAMALLLSKMYLS